MPLCLFRSVITSRDDGCYGNARVAVVNFVFGLGTTQARGFATEGGKFDVILSLERSWVEGDVAVPAEKSVGNPTIGASGQFYQPIIRQFKTELTWTMKDGRTIQTTQAADPLSGRILTITVVMDVVK